MTAPAPAAPAPTPAAPGVPKTSLGAAQWMLARLWFIGAGLILLILIVRTVNQSDPNCMGAACDTTSRFTWFSSAFGPTLLLIAGVISATDDSSATRMVSTQAYRLTLLVSIFYLIAALVPTLARIQDPTQAIKAAAWIPAIQGVVALLMGRLFASSTK